MGVDVLRTAFDFEPKYRVHLLTREDWTKGIGAPPVVKELFWFTDGSKMREGTAIGVYGQSGKKAQLFSWKIRYILSGCDICYLSLCLCNSVSEWIREISEYLL
jgi:hypothetical protein